MKHIEAAKELMRRLQSRDSMLAFLTYLETGFEFSAHHKLIVRELEAVERGEVRNLMLMLPPGSAKSTYASIYFPAWYLGRNPKNSVIAASHTLELAERFGRRVRNLVGSSEYRGIFESGLSPDSQAAGRWETDKGGEYFSAGVGGSITGRRADLGVIDDPVKSREDADSEVGREKAWQWYINDFLTRLKPNSRQVLVMCMTGDTQVLMSDGSQKELRKILPNDTIFTYDNAVLTTTNVVDIKAQGEDNIYEIKTRLGGKLKANLRHPFLVFTEGGVSWKKLMDLKVGDCLIKVSNGAIGRVKNAQNVINPQDAKDCVARTTTNLDGSQVSGLHLATSKIDEKPESKIDTKSHKSNTSKCLQIKEAYAQSANQFTTAQNTGITNSALTTATKETKLEDCCATTATFWSDEGQLPIFLSPQPNILDFILDEVTGISFVGRDEVFDVQVARTENFIANGYVSHNTRWHEDDLAGRILEQSGEEWRVVKIPMEAGEDDPLGRKPDELLWPEWFTDEMVTRAKRDPRSWLALYQQEPRPMGGGEFKRDWVQWYTEKPESIKDSTNRYILVDAANEKKKGNDYTAMWVVGLGSDDNIYILDLIRDRLNLTERCNEAMRLHRKWKPREVRYEKYGMMADIDHIKFIQTQQNYRFGIQEVGGQTPKNDRIRRLIPYFEAGRVWMPSSIHRTMHDGVTRELIGDFVEQELLAFPVGRHDDMIDALARLIEPELALTWPRVEVEEKPERYRKKEIEGSVWTA